MVNETIVEIKDLDDDYDEGYEVVTTKQSIRLKMSMSQDCCEHPGYFFCNENPQDFIGAGLRGISLVDTELNTKKFDEESGGSSEGGTMFVNLDTDKGVLQFVAYNWHNGYYGHSAKIESQQLMHEERL